MSRTGISMNKTNRLRILKAARKLLSNPQRWTRHRLRVIYGGMEDAPMYCVLGACEQAAYDLGLAEPDKEAAFKNWSPDGDKEGFAYLLGMDLSLYAYSIEKYNASPYVVNDRAEYEDVIEMLDGYIAELKEAPANKLRQYEKQS